MAIIEQQTFIDRLNNAEGALADLAIYADNLASRLVGYADEDTPAYPDNMPAAGFLPDVSETASRMSRKVDTIRRSLARINDALPVEHNKVGVPTAKTGKSGQW